MENTESFLHCVALSSCEKELEEQVKGDETMSLLKRLSKADSDSSLWIYKLGERRKMVKLLAILFSFLGDEVFCYPFCSASGFLLLNSATSASWQSVGRRLLRIYGDYGAICLLEQSFKLLFKRARPKWGKQTSFFCIPGEQFSFPSGHSMRAAYAACVLCSSCGLPGAYRSALKNSNILYENDSVMSDVFLSAIESSFAPLVLGVWAIGVALSRVILAKHFLGDAVSGVVVGVIVGLSPYPGFAPRGLVRIFLASCFTMEMVACFASSSLRGGIPGWPFFSAIVVVFWVTFPYAA